jgi:hypothetical protein
MKSTTRMIIVVMLMLCLAITISAQDETNELPNITMLETGESYSGELDVNNILHATLYSFGATEGDTVTISMTSSDEGLLDPLMILYGPSGKFIVFNDDADYPDDINATIEGFEITESGYYYVMATTYDTYSQIFVYGADLRFGTDDAEMVEFDIVVEGNINPETEHDFTMMEISDMVNVEIGAESSIGYVTFAASEGDMMTISTASDDVDTVLYLFDINGNLLAVNDDMDFIGEETNSQIANFEIIEDGIYLLFATVVDYDQINDDNYVTGEIEVSITAAE